MMTKIQNFSLFLLRFLLGWLFFYAGITKILNPAWSAAGYLKGAKTFAGLYNFFLSPGMLPITNFLNEWGLTLIGAALMLGIFARLASAGGILLMALYYFPILEFPYPNAHSFLVDEHVIYAAALLVLLALHAGKSWGLGTWCAKLPFCAAHPRLQSWLN